MPTEWRDKIKRCYQRGFPLKLRSRMLLIYIIGGAIPMILMGLYLMHGTRQILIEEAKTAEVNELQVVKRRLQETVSIVTTVSQYFYFDDDLEQIAFRSYNEYQQVVDDYRAYTAFQDYRGHYNRTLRWISIYMENPSMVGNARFVFANDDIRGQEWYQKSMEGRGAVVWQHIPMTTGGEQYLSLTRLIQSQKKENVGILVEHVRNERLQDMLANRRNDTALLLNANRSVAYVGDRISSELMERFLPNQIGDIFCENVRWEGQEYVLTGIDVPLEESAAFIRIVSLCAYQDILREANRQSMTGVLFCLIGLGVSGIVIFIFSRSFSNRVNRFRLQMQKAAGGDFSLAEHLGGNDEISELYEHLNTMVGGIQRLLAEIYHEQLQREKLNTKQKDAEFKMLASQINPHFLYNTLETIRMKARANGAYEIAELVKMLAKIMRRNIQTGNQAVTIQKEIQLLEYYLKIQQSRFGSRIRYQIDVEDGLEHYKILPLLIQPFVENSIVHGLESKEGGGTIHVTVRRDNADILITVSDDGLGMPSDILRQLQSGRGPVDADKAHIGASNVCQRVRLKYGDGYGVCITSEEQAFTRVEMRIPQELD